MASHKTTAHLRRPSCAVEAAMARHLGGAATHFCLTTTLMTGLVGLSPRPGCQSTPLCTGGGCKASAAVVPPQTYPHSITRSYSSRQKRAAHGRDGGLHSSDEAALGVTGLARRRHGARNGADRGTLDRGDRDPTGTLPAPNLTLSSIISPS